jgi:transcriptional regulator with XRE-family HTH domain
VTVNQRIIKIYENLQITQYRFAKDTGISTATLNNIVTEIEGKPSFSTIQKILTTYKDLNARWLMMGEGKMWIESKEKSGIVNEPPPQYESNKIREVTIYVERECSLTGGACAFTMLPELKAENEKLRKEVEALKNK